VQAGAHIVAEHGVYESCSGDGLIVAAMRDADADLHADVSVVRARDCLWGEPEAELARLLRLPGVSPLMRAARRIRVAAA
jgi:hypothetical protein